MQGYRGPALGCGDTVSWPWLWSHGVLPVFMGMQGPGHVYDDTGSWPWLWGHRVLAVFSAVPTSSPHCQPLSAWLGRGQTAAGAWGSPLTQLHPPSVIYGPSPPECPLADGQRLHVSFLSRTWGFAATSLFTVIFSSDTTRTPTLSGRLSAENKTKLFWDVFPFSSYLGAFPCGEAFGAPGRVNLLRTPPRAASRPPCMC